MSRLQTACALTLALITNVNVAVAQDEAPTLTRVEGEVRIFMNPSKSTKGTPPRVLFGGQYYTAKSAKLGDKLSAGNVIQTAKKSKARLVFQNGDHLSIGPATSYKLSSELIQSKRRTVMELLFGTFRAFIQQGGVREGTKVQTKNMLMGVRGTDFHVGSYAGEHAIVLSVLRGKVEAQEIVPGAKPVEVPAGYSVSLAESGAKTPLPATPDAATAPKATAVPSGALALRKTTEAELVSIQETTTVKRPSKEAGAALSDESTAAALAALEKTSAAATVEEIKRVDPELAAKLSESAVNGDDVDKLQTATVKAHYEKLRPPKPMSTPKPDAPAKKKPSSSGLGGDEDPYEKYFKD